MMRTCKETGIPADSDAFDIHFSKVEKSGMIQQFLVSDHGQIVTCITSSGMNFNLYDAYGVYDYTIYTDITRHSAIFQWDADTLLIYLRFSGVTDTEYHLIRVRGFEDYEVTCLPVNEKTEKLWEGLPQNPNEQFTDEGRYYLHYGNLMFENYDGSSYPVTENTSFHPAMLLLIPILTAVIWFGYAKKQVKAWETRRHHEP